MKNFLTKKWIGPLIVLLYAISLSLFFTHNYTPLIKGIVNVIDKEVQDFLPITIQNGEITHPIDSIITKTIPIDTETFTITLNTKTDTLDIFNLTQDGIYITKKCIYTITKTEKEAQCFSPSHPPEPIIITSKGVQEVINSIHTFINFFLAGTIIALSYLMLYIIIFFYSALMHWIVALFYKTSFSQTLFVNTLILSTIALLGTLNLVIKCNFFIELILCTIINFIICRYTNERKQKKGASNE